MTAVGGANYREEIDGLRAIAVLLVVVFHAFPNDVRGGFVGVDIFFVISGFLITGIIVEDLEARRFRFAAFYFRRSRRLFPALAVVLLACAIGGYLFLLPWNFAALGREILSGALFVENWQLLGEAGYFDRASELKPLLHLWSLGIEEQFYLAWPLTLVAAFRAGIPIFRVAVAVFAISFIWNVLLIQSSPPAAFYLPFTRFWEFMFGAMLATSERRFVDCDARVREGLAFVGILLIVSAVVLLSSHSLFPGWWALLPAAGTSMLILSGGDTMFARHVLRNRTVVQIGLVSYPLYLWHWPILAFARNLHFKEPTSLEKLGCIVLASLLAVLTFRYLERSVRSVRVSLKSAAALAGVLLVCGVAGWQVAAHDGLPNRFPREVQALSRDFIGEASVAMRLGTCFISETEPIFPADCSGKPTASGRKAVIWGDSYAAALYPGLQRVIGETANIQFAQFTASGCPPIFGFDSAHRQCSALSEAVFHRLSELRPDIIILAARWEFYDDRNGWGRIEDAALQNTILRLRELGTARIVLIGQLPVWTAAVPKLVALQALRGDRAIRSSSYLSGLIQPADARAAERARVAGVSFISPLETFCENGEYLLIVPGSEGEPTAYDDGHLTVAASRYFATKNARALLGP